MVELDSISVPCPCLCLSRVPFLGPDLPLFCEAVAAGRLYDLLSELSGLPRAMVKDRFIIDVLAKEKHYPSEVEDVFRETFPSVYAVIRDTNRAYHGTLIRELQKAESWLVVHNVAPKLVNDGKQVVTLHDAIFCRVEDLPAVRDAFTDTFEELGITLALNTEIL